MADVKVKFQDSFGSLASFEGIVEPNGSRAYVFSGTLKAVCKLHRSSTPYKNTVRIGHGCTFGEYSYLDYPIDFDTEKGLEVKGEGTRSENYLVDFRVGVNNGLSGQFEFGNKESVTTGGPPQDISAAHIERDLYGQTKYGVCFTGIARSDGPTGYVIKGSLDAYSGPGAALNQYAVFGCKPSSQEIWQYKTFSCTDTPQDIAIRGRRKSSDSIHVIVGTSRGTLDTSNYGSQGNYAIPNDY